jgi:26S proteasome regulatory subunit N11
MERFQQFMRGIPGSGPSGDGAPLPDAAETVHVSSLSLLKMLKHGRAGVPMEVMGLMLGQFVDDYTIHCVDVFAMPQSGTTVSVEAVDYAFQTSMMAMLQQTGRSEMVVGWYHSHPGFGCWLSSTDINTQSSFESLHPRAVALVVDPVQSVRGKVVVDCFRLIQPQVLMMGQEARQTTSAVGHLPKASIQALIHGLNRHYYSILIDYRKNELEEQMLTQLGQRAWVSAWHASSSNSAETTATIMEKMVALSLQYQERIAKERNKTAVELQVESVGHVDPKRHLEEAVTDLMGTNVLACLGTMLDTVVF